MEKNYYVVVDYESFGRKYRMYNFYEQVVIPQKDYTAKVFYNKYRCERFTEDEKYFILYSGGFPVAQVFKDDLILPSEIDDDVEVFTAC